MYYYNMTSGGNVHDIVKYYRLVAAQGHSIAQHRLGDIYSSDGDVEKACKYYKLAAKQSNEHAHYKLGEIYTKGYEIERDYAKVATHYRFAAKRTHAKAQF